MSLLIYDGATVLDVARQAGHALTMTLDTYGHIFDELAEATRIPAEQLITKAGKAHDTSSDVSVLCLTRSPSRTVLRETPDTTAVYRAEFPFRTQSRTQWTAQPGFLPFTPQRRCGIDAGVVVKHGARLNLPKLGEGLAGVLVPVRSARTSPPMTGMVSSR